MDFLSWVEFFCAFFSLIPAGILINNYRKSKLNDYLINSFLFICIAINMVSDVLDTMYFNLDDPSTYLFPFYFMKILSNLLVYFFLFLHSIRLFWVKTPRKIWFIELFIFSMSFVSIMIIPYEFITKGIITLDFFLSNLWIFQRFFVAILFISVYYFLKPVFTTTRIKSVIRGMKITSILLLIGVTTKILDMYIITPILVSPPSNQLLFSVVFFFNLIDLTSIFLMMLLLSYIAIRYPEEIVISKAQLFRAIHLYKHIKSPTENKKPENLGMDKLIEYLDNIPKELLEDLRI